VIETMRRRLQELGPEESRRLVEALSRQAGRLSRLVDDLATVSRVDAGTLVTVPRPTDVLAVIGEAVAGLPHVPTEVDAQPDLPTAAVDPDRLLQVLSNLVANGEQHGRGTVHLSVRSLDGAIVVRIWDDGPGIPSPRREEVFERFVRLGQTETHSRGTGLGLAIARELVQAMGGSIAVVDHLDGSAFELRLPATPVSATHA
jgi:signal transduction histidine kinase